LCRREGLYQRLYYRWSKEFLEAGKKRLAGDTEREASNALGRFGQQRMLPPFSIGKWNE